MYLNHGFQPHSLFPVAICLSVEGPKSEEGFTRSAEMMSPSGGQDEVQQDKDYKSSKKKKKDKREIIKNLFG